MSEEKKPCTCDNDNVSTDTNPEVPISCLWCKRSSRRRCCRQSNHYWTALNLFNVLMAYLYIGAAVFSSLERSNELQRVEDANTARNDSAMAIVDLLTTQTNLTEEEAMNLTDRLLEIGQRFGEVSEDLNLDENPTWEWGSALFFCVTVVTTIGTCAFGNIIVYPQMLELERVS